MKNKKKYGKLFNSELELNDKGRCPLAIFDGNIKVGVIDNPAYNNVKTILYISRYKRPDHLEIGDFQDYQQDEKDCDNYAFHFNNPESVDVVIDALRVIKNSMIEYKIRVEGNNETEELWK